VYVLAWKEKDPNDPKTYSIQNHRESNDENVDGNIEFYL